MENAACRRKVVMGPSLPELISSRALTMAERLQSDFFLQTVFWMFSELRKTCLDVALPTTCWGKGPAGWCPGPNWFNFLQPRRFGKWQGFQATS